MLAGSREGGGVVWRGQLLSPVLGITFDQKLLNNMKPGLEKSGSEIHNQASLLQPTRGGEACCGGAVIN